MGVERLYNWVRRASAVARRVSDSWRRGVVEKATPDRGGPRKPRWSLGSREEAIKKASIQQWALGLRLSSPIEQERHNVTVITVGSRYYSLCSVSNSLSHANLEQPFRTLAIKWEVYILLKKSSCVFLHASVLLLCHCDAVDEYITVAFISCNPPASNCSIPMSLTGSEKPVKVESDWETINGR